MTAELKRIGAQMANVMFNLAQLPGERITYQQAEAFDSLSRQWDAAVRVTPPSPSTAPTEQDQAKPLPARRFVNVVGFWDADYVEFAEGQEKGAGVLNGVPHSKHYTRSEAESYVAEGAWREVSVSLSVEQSVPAGAARQGGNTSSSTSVAAPIAEGELPPLPGRTKFYPDRHGYSLAFTSDQMRAYGQECARAALAAKTTPEEKT